VFEAHLTRAVERYRGSSAVAEMIRYHFGYDAPGNARRGKRLRPHLLIRVALEEGGTIDAALDPAAAIEILHNYSLVHDDIEDGDEMRHGRTTIWARYGVAHGINAGDAMCAISYLTLLHAGDYVPSERVAKMMQVLHEANLAMCDGQALDIGFERAAGVAMSEYLAMIAGKTAALFGAACELGALSAGAAAERVAAYGAFGRYYGRAFQIRDDVLGTWGDPDVTGKPSGADIARRKWSFPVVWALAQVPSAERDLVAEAYSRGAALCSGDVAAVVAALDRLGARRAADDAHDAALAEAERVAGEAGIDPGRSVRELVLEGVRRVA
jgi:geranylgeranyl diphosphate synthase type I